MSEKSTKKAKSNRMVNIDDLHLCVDLEKGFVVIGIPNKSEGDLIYTDKDAVFKDITDDFYEIMDAMIQIKLQALKNVEAHGKLPPIIESTDVEAAKRISEFKG